MKVTIKAPDSNTRKIVVEGEDVTIFNMLRYKLLEYKTISLAGFEQEHPLIDKVCFVVKASKTPKEVVISAMKKLEQDWKDLEIK